MMDIGAGRDRVRSAAAVAALHLALGYAFLAGLDFDVPGRASEGLKLFDVAAPPPPPVQEQRRAPERPSKEPEGAAAPPNLMSRPVPVVAPVPEVALSVPSPVTVAPVAGAGPGPSAGAASVAGPGSGAGGDGTGTGSGGAGSGTGGGEAAAVRARLVRGRISNSDYPRAASRGGAGGTVEVRFTVQPNGRAAGCRVTRSSGHLDLDVTTCRLIEKRFRYTPARNAQGRPVPEEKGWRQVWWLEPRGEGR